MDKAGEAAEALRGRRPNPRVEAQREALLPELGLLDADVTLKMDKPELRVNIDRAEVIDQHRNPQAMIAMQNVVEERGFAGTKETGEHGNRDAIIDGCVHG